MNFIQGILADRTIEALGWTIIHSLWQGLVIGILLFVLLYLFRNHNASIRYNLSVFSLVFIFLVSLLTYISCFRNATHNNFAIQSLGSASPDLKNASISSGNDSGNGFGLMAEMILSFFNRLSSGFPLIITLWLTGVLIISTRMTFGLFITYRLRHNGLHGLPEEILNRFHTLMRKMKIHREVRIFGSPNIEIPSLVGYFKPLILLPISAFSHVPVEQLEAIIAHELAHIRRHDYLVNLFQSAMEALFFYHPVVWVIQKQIRKERENCCDDLALAYSDGEITYIKALVTIQDIPVKAGFPLLALGSEKNHLLNRIMRILKNRKMKTNVKDKLLAGAILLSATVIILLSTGGKLLSHNFWPVMNADTNSASVVVDIKLPPPAPATAPLPAIPAIDNVEPADEPVKVISPAPLLPPTPPEPQDTSLKIKDNVVQRTLLKDGKETNYRIRIEHGKVTELFVNDKKIPEKDFGKYQAEIDETLRTVNQLETELEHADQELQTVSIEEIEKELQESMSDAQEQLAEIDLDAVADALEDIQVPEIDREEIQREIETAMKEIQSMDTEKMKAEMEFAMQSVCEEMKKIDLPDMDEIKLELEKAMQEMQEIPEIDREKLQSEIEETLKNIQFDKQKLSQEMEHSMQQMKEMDMEKIREEMEKGRQEVEEMLKEIQKLELEEK